MGFPVYECNKNILLYLCVCASITVNGHTQLTLEHVSFYSFFFFFSNTLSYILQHIILIYTHIYLYIYMYILHLIRILYYSHLACHASKQIMTKILIHFSFNNILLKGILLFSKYIFDKHIKVL